MRAFNVLQPLYAVGDAEEMEKAKDRMLTAWDELNSMIDNRSLMLRNAEALSNWLSWLRHSLNWIAFTQDLIDTAKQRERDTVHADDSGLVIWMSNNRRKTVSQSFWKIRISWLHT